MQWVEVDYLRRKQITRYFRFLTLFCGRGCTYLFLSTLSFSMLNDLAGFKFLGYVCGGSVFLVGCLSLSARVLSLKMSCARVAR